MLQEKKSKRGAWIALGCVAALLVLVIVLENTMQPTSMLFTVLKKGAVYALVAASLNLLNGFTGLFSLGQAGFMLLGAYTYAILTIPSADRESVYYLYGGSAVNFSLPELFGGGAVGLVLGVLLALFLGMGLIFNEGTALDRVEGIANAFSNGGLDIYETLARFWNIREIRWFTWAGLFWALLVLLWPLQRTVQGILALCAERTPRALSGGMRWLALGLAVLMQSGFLVVVLAL